MKKQLKNISMQLIIMCLFSFFTIHAQDSTTTKKQEQGKDQKQHGTNFVDKDGDGFNDNAPDHDGDGIPNGLDPDYKGPCKERKKKFVDLDGDGIDDNIYEDEENKKFGGIGPKNKSTSTQSGESKQTMKRKRSGQK